MTLIQCFYDTEDMTNKRERISVIDGTKLDKNTFLGVPSFDYRDRRTSGGLWNTH